LIRNFESVFLKMHTDGASLISSSILLHILGPRIVILRSLIDVRANGILNSLTNLREYDTFLVVLVFIDRSEPHTDGK